jgi:hypothetical protein
LEKSKKHNKINRLMNSLKEDPVKLTDETVYSAIGQLSFFAQILGRYREVNEKYMDIAAGGQFSKAINQIVLLTERAAAAHGKGSCG